MPDLLSAVLFVASIVAIAYGVALIYFPASLIVGGALTAGLTIAYERGRTVEPPA